MSLESLFFGFGVFVVIACHIVNSWEDANKEAPPDANNLYQPDRWEYLEPSQGINPATGLPMVGATDVHDNHYGTRWDDWGIAAQGVNPSTGLPMAEGGAMDVGGNAFGSPSHDSFGSGSTFDGGLGSGSTWD